MNNAIDKKIVAFENYSAEYAFRFKDVALYKKHLTHISQLLEKNGTIIDFACGPCMVSEYIYSERLDLSFHCVDISPSMIEIGKIKLPSAQFFISDIRHYAYGDFKYNGALCSFGFPFLTTLEIESFMQNLSQNLHKNSYVYISTMQGEKEGYETTSFSGECPIYFIYHNREKLNSIFAQNGFTIVEYHEQLFPQQNAEDLIDMIYILKFG